MRRKGGLLAHHSNRSSHHLVEDLQSYFSVPAAEDNHHRTLDEDTVDSEVGRDPVDDSHTPSTVQSEDPWDPIEGDHRVHGVDRLAGYTHQREVMASQSIQYRQHPYQ